MGPLMVLSARAVALGLALLAAQPSRADRVINWHAPMAEASARFGIPIAWIERVMRAESDGVAMRDGRPTTSSAGAMGLMQIMPATWADMRIAHGLGADPYEPRDNILAGTAYLRVLYDRFGYPGLFGAYHAGPARYARHLATGHALPAETTVYLAKLSGPSAAVTTLPVASVPLLGLFVVMHGLNEPGDVSLRATPVGDGPDGLFALRNPR